MKNRTFENFAFAPLYIGYHGENLVTGVDIDLAGFLPDGWGAGLLLRRAGESSEYEATSTLEGSVLRVTFETFDAMIEGRGEATIELRGPNGEIRKSGTAQTIVEHALDLSGVPPERPELYRTAAQQDVIDAGKLSKAAQAEKTEEMTQPVGVDDDGKLWALPGGGGGSSDSLWRPTVDGAGNISWEKSTSSTVPATQNIKGQPGVPGRDGTDGQDGRDGATGEDGFSPAVTVAQITGGHRVNITDKTHPSGQSFDVMDGEDGAQGVPGTPGADGHSPVVTATKSGKVTTVKVDGTAIATINDGADGAPGTKGDTGAAAGFGTPTATVDANVGTPSVTVTAIGEDTSKVFSFAFHNLKGQQGQQGVQGIPGTPGTDGADGVSPEVTISTISGGHSVKITDEQHPSGQSFDVLDGEDGAPGVKGDTGAAAGFGTPTATVDANVGTPSVTVTASGEDTSKVFSFEFRNLKGEQGQQGVQGIPGTPGTDGQDGAPGQDGQDGADGKSAYESAQDGGYTGTEAQFNSDLADVGEKIGDAPDDGQQYARKNKAWAVVQESSLPEVTTDDDGEVLRVVDGEWDKSRDSILDLSEADGAEVGLMLTAAAVDENGKVTKWEFTDGSGAGVTYQDMFGNPAITTEALADEDFKRLNVTVPDGETPIDSISMSVTGKNLFDKRKVVNGQIGGSGASSVFQTFFPVTTYGYQITALVPLVNGASYSIRQSVISETSWARRFGLIDEIPTTNAGTTPCFGLSQSDWSEDIRGFQALSVPFTDRLFVNKFNHKYLAMTVYYDTYNTHDEDAMNAVLDSIQVELGTASTSYEAFNGETKEIALMQSVYGGTLDVLNGKFTTTGGEEIIATSWKPKSISGTMVISASVGNILATYVAERTSKKADNPLRGKKIVAIGDSMVYGHSLNDGRGEEWSDSDTWLGKLAYRNEMRHVNYGVNGCYLSHNPKEGQTIYDVYARYQSMDNDADYVIVFAGTNDCNDNITIGTEDSTDPTTFYGALNAICDGLQAKYPMAKIAFITPYARSGIKGRCKDYRNAICTACERGGIPVFDNIKNGGINWDVTEQVTALTLNDTYHLNVAGMEWASKKYEKFLLSI